MCWAMCMSSACHGDGVALWARVRRDQMDNGNGKEGVMARRAMGLLDCCLHVQRRKDSWTVLHVVKIKIEAIESTLAFLNSCWSKEKCEDE